MIDDMQITQMQETGEATFSGVVSVRDLAELSTTLGIDPATMLVEASGDVLVRVKVQK